MNCWRKHINYVQIKLISFAGKYRTSGLGENNEFIPIGIPIDFLWIPVDPLWSLVDSLWSPVDSLWSHFVGPIYLLGPIGPGPYWPHLGDSFDEVIGFITTLASPGCVDGKVSSSDHRTTEYDEKLLQESLKYYKMVQQTLTTAKQRLT